MIAQSFIFKILYISLDSFLFSADLWHLYSKRGGSIYIYGVYGDVPLRMTHTGLLDVHILCSVVI